MAVGTHADGRPLTAPALKPADTRLEIRPGAVVVTDDDELGRVDRVVISPASGEITGLVVRKGLLLRRDVVLPIQLVEEAKGDYVRVRIDRSELDRLPAYREEDYLQPAAAWQSSRGHRPEDALILRPRPPAGSGLRPAGSGQTDTAAGGMPIRAGQRVVCQDGEVGSLDLVLVDAATGRATYFVVRRGRLLGRDTMVPVEWVRRIERDRIELGVVREQLDELPEYRPDEEITRDVLDALWYRDDLQSIDLQFVEVRTRGGIVHLLGHTLNDRSRKLIEEVASGVRGVLDVRNQLETFEELAEAIAAAQGRPDEEAAVGAG